MRRNRFFLILFLFFSLIFYKKILSYEFVSTYSNFNFSSYNNAKSIGMLFSDISLIDRNSPNYSINPALGFFFKENFLFYSHQSMFENLYTIDNIQTKLDLSSNTNVFLYLDWINYGKWYQTTYLPYDEETSYYYWDPDFVIEREAYDILFKTIISKKYNKKLYFGISFNFLYRNIEITSIYGSSVDLGFLYKVNKNLNISLVFNSFGASMLKTKGDDTLEYSPMYVSTGLSYKIFENKEKGQFLKITLSDNSIFLDNKDIKVGGDLGITNVIEVFGAISYYKEKGMGIKLNLRKLNLSVSQVIDEDNIISRNISFKLKL